MKNRKEMIENIDKLLSEALTKIRKLDEEQFTKIIIELLLIISILNLLRLKGSSSDDKKEGGADQ